MKQKEHAVMGTDAAVTQCAAMKLTVNELWKGLLLT